jgi:hypothetical protein
MQGNLSGLPSLCYFPSWHLPQGTLDESSIRYSPFPSPSNFIADLTRLDYLPPLIMFNDDIYPSSKDFVSQPLYVHQPCTIQIIQLVECSSPPPQQKYTPSRISSSYYSTSNSDGSVYDSSSPSLSDASSYCSSAEERDAQMAPSFNDRDPSVDDTYRTRQRRVSLWRDAVYSKNDTPSGSSFTHSDYSPFCVLLLIHRM